MMVGIRFRQAIFVEGRFDSWHYWGFVDGGFLGPADVHLRKAQENSYQYTGLTDCNDADDYVGNIWEVEYRGEKHRFLREVIVGWFGYEFSFKCLTGRVSPVHAAIEEDGIIGNKIEHPQLLKG